MKRVIDYDPLTRISTTFDYDPVTDITTVGRIQDVEPILELNKTLQNQHSELDAKGRKDAWWHYASIPIIVIEKWKKEYGVDVFNKSHAPRVFKLLNDPEYRYLKLTTKIHVPRAA